MPKSKENLADFSLVAWLKARHLRKQENSTGEDRADAGNIRMQLDEFTKE